MKLSFAIFVFILANNVFADCGYTLSVPAINYTASDSNTTVVQAVNLSRSSAGNSTCDNFRVGFSQGGSNSYTRKAINSSTGASLNYNLYQNSNASTILKTITDATSNSEVLSGTMAKNGSANLNYYFALGLLNSISTTRGGIYQDLVTVVADSPFNGVDSTQSLFVNIFVPKIASLSLVNSGASFDAESTNKTIDFGELTENEEMSFDVIVSSNAGYNLSVSSANNQVMKLSGASLSANTQVGYDFYANGVQKNLTSSASSPVSLAIGSGVTPLQGTRVPIKVVIQSVTNKDPGTYQDYVTFTIATTE